MANIEITKKIPLELICITLLEERDMYGYEMVQELKKRSDGMLAINITTLYLALKRLTDKGYVSMHYSTEGDTRERSRIYYHYESSAAEYKEKLFSEYQRAVMGVQKFFDYRQEVRTGEKQ